MHGTCIITKKIIFVYKIQCFCFQNLLTNDARLHQQHGAILFLYITWLVASFSLHKSGFDPTSVHVRLTAVELVVRWFLLRVLRFFPYPYFVRTDIFVKHALLFLKQKCPLLKWEINYYNPFWKQFFFLRFNEYFEKSIIQ